MDSDRQVHRPKAARRQAVLAAPFIAAAVLLAAMAGAAEPGTGGCDDRPVEFLEFQTGVDQGFSIMSSTFTAADFDRDGNLDIAISDLLTGSVGTLLGDGKGGLRISPLTSMESPPTAMATADFDGDGFPDLVSVTSWGLWAVAYTKGLGDGTFAAPVILAQGEETPALAIADLNGDGKPDLAVTRVELHAVGIFLGRGDGTFGEMGTFPVRNGPRSLAAGDLDGDGRTDLVVGNQESSDLSILLGRGDGTFRAGEICQALGPPGPIALEDLDGNGTLDLVVAYQGYPWFKAYIVFLGAGDGTFQTAGRQETGIEAMEMLVRDLDGDGRTDLILSGRQLIGQYISRGLLNFFKGTGDGTFGSARILPVRATTFAADLDGNGLEDLLYTGGPADASIQVLLNRTTMRLPPDCDGDGIPDACWIAADPSRDADGNGIPDSCEAPPEPPRDCDGDGIDDRAAIASGAVPDCDGDGIPDSCGFHPPGLDLRAGESYATAESPRVLAAADLDGDGTIDLAASGDMAGPISIHPGRGDGTFADPWSVPLDPSYRLLGTADLSGDGAPDLIVCRSDAAGIAFCRAAGSGSFLPPATIDGSAHPLNLISADFNKDGKTDLAWTDPEGSSPVPSPHVAIALGNGDGGFQPVRKFPSRDSELLVAADFTGLGGVDLAVAAYQSQSIRIWKGLGDGTFIEGPVILTGAPLPSLAAGDLDGDGSADLVSLEAFGVLMVLFNQRDGTFLIGPQLFLDSWAPAVAVLDLDRDGRNEIVVGTYDYLAIFRCLDGRRIGQPVRIGAGTVCDALVAADLDGDGNLDLALSDESEGGSKLLVFRGMGGGAIRGATMLACSAAVPTLWDFLAADVNGDGRQDLMIISGTDAWTINVSLSEGDGSWRAIEDPQPPESGHFNLPGDFDGDGKLDFLIDFKRLHPGRGDGTFQKPLDVTMDVAPGSFRPSPMVGDLDGDGRQDFVLLRSTGAQAYLSKGTATFLAAAEPIPFGVDPRDAILADLDGDGRLDLAAANPGSYDLWVSLGRGDGTFRPQVSYPAGDVPVSFHGPTMVAAADLDVDGSLDLIAALPSDQLLCVLHNRGDGTFDPARQIPLGGCADTLVAVDLDGDGAPDLAIADSCRNALTVLRGRGDGTFGPPRPFAAGPGNPTRVVALESGRRGVKDLIVRSQDRSGRISIVQVPNLSIPSSRDCNRNGIHDPCDIRGGTSADLDGNAIPDECEPDCDGNGIQDAEDIRSGGAQDCNGNGIPDPCGIASGTEKDADGNGVPDGCQPDCNRNGIPDSLDISKGTSKDCDSNGVPDECDLASGIDLDIDRDGILDRCEPDCNGNGFPDHLEIGLNLVKDCDANGIPDGCDIQNSAADCNGNLIPDACELAAGTTADRNHNGIPDACEGGWQRPGDCDQDGALSIADAICLLGTLFLGEPARLPCGSGKTDGPSLVLLDWQPDRTLDVSDAVEILDFLFLGGPAHAKAPPAAAASGCIRILDCPDTSCR